MYYNVLDDELKKLEELLNLSLEQLNIVDQSLNNVYDVGFENGKNTRSDSDYDEGYKDGHRDCEDE